MVRHGVLSRSMGPVITMVPPLTITADEIEHIVTTLGAALTECAP
jgi:adenosylmethionine-8-amino-7-oxononanoate aminotransferase